MPANRANPIPTSTTSIRSELNGAAVLRNPRCTKSSFRSPAFTVWARWRCWVRIEQQSLFWMPCDQGRAAQPPVTCALLRSRSMATGWNDLRHPQADRIEERSVLSVAALTSAGYDQHVQVKEPVEGRIPGSNRRTLPFSV